MKAVIWTNYGAPDGLILRDVEKPTPKHNQVLIKIQASSVTAGDCEMRRLKFPLWLAIPLRLYVGIRKPKRIQILGQEFSGVVEAVGQDVTRFKPGDEIFGTTGFGFGAYAEYICVPENPADAEGVIITKPSNMTFEEAAVASTGGLEALYFLQKAKLEKGQKILINGAGGSIGTFAIQLAKHWGAEVTAVDHTDKLEMLRSIGADHVVDYTKETFTHTDKKYDVVFDIIGKGSFSGVAKLLNPKGRYLLGNTQLLKLLRGMFLINKRLIGGTSPQRKEDLIFLRELIEIGALKSVIDRTYSLAEMATAHEYVESGRKKGNLVIKTC